MAKIRIGNHGGSCPGPRILRLGDSRLGYRLQFGFHYGKVGFVVFDPEDKEELTWVTAELGRIEEFYT